MILREVVQGLRLRVFETAGAERRRQVIRRELEQRVIGCAEWSARTCRTETQGAHHLAIREQRPAQETLELLHRRDPGHRLSDADASPVVVSAFARARER